MADKYWIPKEDMRKIHISGATIQPVKHYLPDKNDSVIFCGNDCPACEITDSFELKIWRDKDGKVHHKRIKPNQSRFEALEID